VKAHYYSSMLQTLLIIALAFYGALPVEAADANLPSGCKIEKLPGIESQKTQGWELSILKESKRGKPGDAFLAIAPGTGKRCEIELDSWGTALFVARSQKLLVLVEQGDTDYSAITWIDPTACKSLKNVREIGLAKISNTALQFSGGQDGPTKISAKNIPLNSECLPAQ